MTTRQLSFVDGERDRIVTLLKTALERGYTDEQLRQYLQGAVDFNEVKA